MVTLMNRLCYFMMYQRFSLYLKGFPDVIDEGSSQALSHFSAYSGQLGVYFHQ
mgnify:CR=1 FL=1